MDHLKHAYIKDSTCLTCSKIFYFMNKFNRLVYTFTSNLEHTVQKIKSSVMNFSSKCDQI